jgi:hypothetical protein
MKKAIREREAFSGFGGNGEGSMPEAALRISPHDQDLPIGKFHPCEIVDDMIRLILVIDIKGCKVVEVKFLSVEDFPVQLFLLAVLTHHFQENGPVSVQDLIGFADFQSGRLS